MSRIDFCMKTWARLHTRPVQGQTHGDQARCWCVSVGSDAGGASSSLKHTHSLLSVCSCGSSHRLGSEQAPKWSKSRKSLESWKEQTASKLPDNSGTCHCPARASSQARVGLPTCSCGDQQYYSQSSVYPCQQGILLGFLGQACSIAGSDEQALCFLLEKTH